MPTVKTGSIAQAVPESEGLSGEIERQAQWTWPVVYSVVGQRY